MARIVVKEIILDEKNLEHIKRHNVAKEDVEASKNILYHKRSHSGRYLAVSKVGSRLISLVLKRKNSGKYYLITARDTSRKERRKLYEIEKKK